MKHRRFALADVPMPGLGTRRGDQGERSRCSQSRRRVRFVGVGGKVYGGAPYGFGEFGVAERVGAGGVDQVDPAVG
jgi:hypothetical protein